MNDLITAVKENNYLKVKQALKNNQVANLMVEISEDEFAPILFYALRCRNSLDIFQLLLEYGADIDYVTDDGVGILDEAVIFANLEIIKFLVEDKGMDVNNTKRKSGMTPFMQSCCYGNFDVIEYLYKRGADIYKKDKTGMSAYDYAKKLGKKDVVKYLDSLLNN